MNANEMPQATLPSSHSRHNNFDLLRLLLALLVLMSHGRDILGLPYTSSFFYQAELAVNGFFIISGFLISWSIDRSFRMKGYALKRIARIYPLYAVVVTVQLFLLWWFNTAPADAQEMLTYYISNMASLNFIKPFFGTMVNEPINGSLWTIKVELMFYAVIPFYIWFLRRFGLPWLVFSFACAFAYRFGVEQISIQWARQIPGSMAFFIAGSTAYFYGAQLLEWLKKPRVLALLLLAMALLGVAAMDNYYAMRLLYVFILTAGLYGIAFHLPKLSVPTDISYGVYLWHVPVFLTVRHVMGTGNDPVSLFALGTIIIIVLAWLSALWIEIPCIRWAGRKAKTL